MTVDEALEWAENRFGATNIIEHGPAFVLAAEVRRLRAMLEPTPDARELALLLAEGVWERNTLYVGARNQWLAYSAQLIAAHDARLRAMSGDLFGEIFERLCPAGWDKDDWVHECFSIMQDIAPESAAHDAHLLDEAAERARKKCYEYLAYGVNNGCALVNVEEVCAAVRGKGE